MTYSTGMLTGKVAVVTGVGRGIGRAIALAYAREGASGCCAARTSAGLKRIVTEIEQLGRRALAMPADVTKPESVSHMLEATEDRFGGLDILVINAGGDYNHNRVEDGDPADWLATLEVNLTGAYYCAREAIPYLKRRRGGKITTIGSGIGHRGRAGSSAYASSKAGLWMLTRVLAQELWGYDISVNELVPGPVMTEGVRETYADREDSVFGIDGKWIKEPEDVTQLALFLATQPKRDSTAQSFSLMRRDS